MKIHNADIRLITDDILYFEEINDGITYELEKFIQELKKFIDIGSRRVICRDDAGNYDEMIFEFGDFYRFEVLRDNDSIIKIIKSYLER